MDKDMQKLASEVPAVLAETARHMKKVAHRNVELEQENAQLQRDLRLHKLAHRMEERGLETGLDFTGKVAHLQNVPSDKLGVLEQAVEFTHGGFKLASLKEAEDDNKHGDVHSEGGTVAHHNTLDAFITSGRALS